jgi:hypothetical protein
MGIVELADSTETEARTDSTRAVTPSGLTSFLKTTEVYSTKTGGSLPYSGAAASTGIATFYAIGGTSTPGIYVYTTTDTASKNYWQPITHTGSGYFEQITGTQTITIEDVIRKRFTLLGTTDITISERVTSGIYEELNDLIFYYFTDYTNGDVEINIPNTTVVWKDDPPFIRSSGKANNLETYMIRMQYTTRFVPLIGWQRVAILEWTNLSSSNGEVNTTKLEGYTKTVYRTVTAASSGTILGSATGIANQYVQVSAYETGTPNTIVGIDYTVAANGDIAWTASSAFTGFIVVSGAVTPVNV